MAGQIAGFLKAQRRYVALVGRYNPSLGGEDDGWGTGVGENGGMGSEEERVRRSARRVGLVVPGKVVVE